MTKESGDYGTSNNPKLVEAQGRGDNMRSVFGRPSPDPEPVEGDYLPPEGTTEVTSHWDEEGASRRPMVDQRAAPRIARRVTDQRELEARNPRYEIPLVEPTGDFRPIRSRAKDHGAKKNGQGGAATADRRNMAKGLASLFNAPEPDASSSTTATPETSNGRGNGAMAPEMESEPRLTGRVQPDETTARIAAAPTPESAGPTKAPPRVESAPAPPPPKANPYGTEPEPNEPSEQLGLDVYHDELGALEMQLRQALAEVEFWRRGTLLAFFMAVGAALVVFWPF